WMLLHRITGERRYAEAAFAANAFVRRTVRLDGPAAIRGAVKGSFPIDGAYGRFQYLSWAVKFLADSLMTESDVHREVVFAAHDAAVVDEPPTHKMMSVSQAVADPRV
ncbi:MAG TPA: hypothetical protein VFK10_07005, partial [Burkholderiaceae bacterium]|nr:hypothetical protein [Burkholderiaceae bacterium]